MPECPRFNQLLVLPRLRVQNANAISGPLTHGFPAITAFLGLMWALQRRLANTGMPDAQLHAVGVICHGHQEQVSDDYIKTFRLTRNPVGRDGKTLGIVEEGRIHLEVSLVFALGAPALGIDTVTDAGFAAHAGEVLSQMRVAGGTLLPSQKRPYLLPMTGDIEGRKSTFRTAMRRLLPGFALVARDDLLQMELQTLRRTQPQATALDAWLKRSRVNYHYDAAAQAWVNDRAKGSGWMVPIPVGYAGLGDVQPPGTVAAARDATTPFRFVESLYSLGEWVSPHRLSRPEQLLWYADAPPEQEIYRCRNDYALPNDAPAEFDWNLY